MGRGVLLLVIMLIAGACSVFGGDTSNNPPATAASNPSNNNQLLISWDKNPLHIIFQADVTGGDNASIFWRANHVPLCTIYGDGRVVWSASDDSDTLFDFLSDEQIIDFVSTLTVDERFYTYRTRAETQLPTSSQPVVEQLTLDVNGLKHQSDSFGSWPPNYFDRLVEKCSGLAKTPRTFQPSEGWLSVQIVGVSNAPIILWDATAAGLSLKEVAAAVNSTVWLDNALVLPVWTSIRETGFNVQFSEDGTDYNVVLRVPGVTVNAPAPPSSDDKTFVTEEAPMDNDIPAETTPIDIEGQ